MRDRLSQHPEFDTKIRNDVYYAIDLAKEYMEGSVKVDHCYLRLQRTLGAFYGCKIAFDESGDEHYARFQQEAARVHKSLGTAWLDHYIKQTPEYDEATDAAKKKMLENAWDKYQAVIYFKNLCPILLHPFRQSNTLEEGISIQLRPTLKTWKQTKQSFHHLQY